MVQDPVPASHLRGPKSPKTRLFRILVHQNPQRHFSPANSVKQQWEQAVISDCGCPWEDFQKLLSPGTTTMSCSLHQRPRMRAGCGYGTAARATLACTPAWQPTSWERRAAALSWPSWTSVKVIKWMRTPEQILKYTQWHSWHLVYYVILWNIIPVSESSHTIIDTRVCFEHQAGNLSSISADCAVRYLN